MSVNVFTTDCVLCLCNSLRVVERVGFVPPITTNISVIQGLRMCFSNVTNTTDDVDKVCVFETLFDINPAQ